MAAPQQGGGQSDHSAGILWGIAALFATVAFIWYAFKNQLVSFYLTIKLAELNFIAFILSALNFDLSNIDQLRNLIQSVKAQSASLTFDNMMIIGSVVGKWLRIPLVVLLFVLAVVVYLGNTARIFKHIYKMLEFAKLEKVNWPQITPVVGLDLIKEDIDKGPWAMAMSPMQFCKAHRLLQEVKPERREGMARKDWDRIDVILRRGEANRMFAMQLGQLWGGVSRLPPYAKALFAA